MRRRRFLSAVAAAPAASALFAQQPQPSSQQPAPPAGPSTQPGRGGGRGPGGGGSGPAILETVSPDDVGQTEAKFFTAPQMAALRKLCDLIQPARQGSLSAVECHVPEFLDFLLGVSPADRQTLYRNGLDSLNAQAKKQFNKSFGEVDEAQAKTILTPMLVAVPWVTDPPKDPLKHFMFAVRQDIPQATRNSPEFALAGGAAGGRRGGGGQVWKPIDPVYRG